MNNSINRREFLSYSFYSGALLIACPLSAIGQSTKLAKGNGTITPLLSIHQDNRIIFYSPSPEMGQGINTSLSMLFVEELGGDMKNVSVESLPYSLKRDAENKVAWQAVPQFSGGSTSISRNWTLLREAGATVKQLFLLAASKVFKTPIESLTAEMGFVNFPGGRKVSFGYLAELAATQSLSENFELKLTDRKNWRFIGKPHHTQESLKIVTGQPLYAMDMQYPGAKVCVVARCPYFDGEIESVDTTQALKIKGVHKIVELERPDVDKFYTYLAAGVAVIADNFWTAKKAREALSIVWKKGPNPNESTKQLHQQCDDLLKGTGQVVRQDGNYSQAIGGAQIVITREYVLPLVSHAQLEPQNCIAHVTRDNCTIIGPMQGPGGAGRHAERITGFYRVNMDIRYPRLGGGFGRRLTNDHIAEAVEISKRSGLAIKLIWTREDDLRHDFYRPMGHHQVTAGIDASGKVIAWSHRLAGTPKYYRRDGEKQEEYFKADMYIDDFPAGRVENIKNEYFVAKFLAPQGSWRAPAHTANAFVIQSFVDEVALELGKDPLTMRLEMLGKQEQLPYGQHGGPTFDTGRMANVLKTAAKSAGWGRTTKKGTGLGIAGHFTFGGYCACVAEVNIAENGSFRVDNVFAAIDVGTVVNPEGVISQVEGGINDGLSTALAQQIIVQNNQVVNDNFDRYHMMRMADSVRNIEVDVIESMASPSGAGEMGIPPLAPAVANAIAAAGGPRIRQQPMLDTIG